MGKNRNSKRNNNHQNDSQGKRKQEASTAPANQSTNLNEAFVSSPNSSARTTPTAINHPHQHQHPFHSFTRITLCSLCGMLLGFGFGSGYFTGMNGVSSPWRIALGMRIRSTSLYESMVGHNHMNSFPPYPGARSVASDTFMKSGSTNEQPVYHHSTKKKKSSKSGNGHSKTTKTKHKKLKEHTLYRDFYTPAAPTVSQSMWNYFAAPFYTFFMLTTPSYYRAYSYTSNLYDDDYDPSISIQNLPTPGVGTGQYDSSHPMMFAALRESIIREKGGYVHPDVGILTPAPCGASRGLGMVRNSFSKCQTQCFPGDTLNQYYYDDSESAGSNSPTISPTTTTSTSTATAASATSTFEPTDMTYEPQEILLKIPLSSQLTRKVALKTLIPLLPNEIRHRLPLEDLDDPILLALLLAHERGRFRESKYQAYISTLPQNPTCGLGISSHQRKNLVEVLRAFEQEIGYDINGWHGEIRKAREYADRITSSLARDYGNYIIPLNSNNNSQRHGRNRHQGRQNGQSKNSNSNLNQHTNNMSPYQLIQWALCTVASRAIQGIESHGQWRLVPILDLINHDEEAAEVVELGADIEIEKNGNYAGGDENESDAYSMKNHQSQNQEREKKRWNLDEDDAGAMIVRSMRYDLPNHLKKGQELLINYSIPHYSPLDWFINLGFIPIERSLRWKRLVNALPGVSRS